MDNPTDYKQELIGMVQKQLESQCRHVYLRADVEIKVENDEASGYSDSMYCRLFRQELYTVDESGDKSGAFVITEQKCLCSEDELSKCILKHTWRL